jgi:hypothetical protein
MAKIQYPGPLRRRHGADASLLALVLLSRLAPAAAEENHAGAWRLEPGLEIRMVTYYLSEDSQDVSYPAAGAHLSVELSSPERPFAAGLFADHELPAHAERNDIRLAGGWVRYRHGRWEVSSTVARFASGHESGLWLYKNKLQVRPRPGHTFSVEAIGAVDGGGGPALQLVYATDLTRRVSLCLSVGLGSNRLLDLGASTKITWELF